MKNLIYILINFDTKVYLKMFELFFTALTKTSDLSKFDFLIITQKNIEDKIKKIINNQINTHFLFVDKDPNLSLALLHKFDIIDFPKYLDYKKIMYIDIDILVIKDINILFKTITNIKDNIIYASKEGKPFDRFWTFSKYNDDNVKFIKDNKITSFNSGTFIFKPSESMKEHFKNIKEIGMDYYLHNKPYFYDQSIMNYYFNRVGLNNTILLTKYIQIFPEINKDYSKSNKVILHFAGIGRYKEKVNILKKYIKEYMN